ncbi:NADH dehydrogenase FAD-containing subunit [Romboutsia weinsteinii]|uniref:NADH:ubiquinone reductase (non-electrogenic) n=1 Tax=Romboutsia weinsteinii TaxID=2020949 RepID=A0A371IY77_9FIRM|nr:FAD-dependent oxidoreductase [Romboutsia weinsteinii]RDY25418.1 NADH dehydrogenase FAD-containing subunit [Romboutsia weinsteinii]
MSTKIVILGAGYAGVHAAKKLSKKYKKNHEVEITLIDKNPYHTLMTELHEVAGGRVPEESVKVDLYRIFHKTKVNVVVDYIENVDSDNNVVNTKEGKYNYDYLIVGMGSEPAFFGVNGVKENGFTLWSLEDALKIKAHIKNTVKEASYVRDARKRQKMLTFVVAGSGFTGIEMAGELLEWKATLAREYRVDENEIKILVVEAMSTILNMLDRKQADKAERYMVKHGVEILKDSPIVEVTKDKIKLKDGKVIPTETLIWTCGVQANQDLEDLDVKKARAGRYSANKYMQAEEKENIYVVGDIAYVEETPGNGNPQIVEAAEQTAVTAVKNIIASMENKEKTEFKSNYHGFMVSIGGRYGVANLMGIKLSGFFAMVMKHIINMVYLLGVNDVHAIYHYLQHEFFAMKERRCIMRGHLASKGNRLWLIPLRLYIGCLWLIEGLKKLIGEETWAAAFDTAQNALSTDGIGGYVDALTSNLTIGWDSWMKMGNVKMPFEWLQDAVSGASQAVEGAANMPQPIFETMPKFYEFIMKIFMPNPEIAVWFQRIVVLTEIALGLCLIVGLFTFLASAASAFMTVNFIFSAMAGWDILWFTFGSIALMSGAGRTFGLDYYIIPWINELTGNIWMGKRRPIYDIHAGNKIEKSKAN